MLVDGELGCGKSSLIEFGLVPKLKEDESTFPVLVGSYGGDWDLGLAGKIFEAIWSGLSKEDREKIGFLERPAVGSVDASTVRAAFEQIGAKIGRLPVLILDQFDDYQLSAREQFLGKRRDWIKPAELARKNQTWATIRDLLQTKKVRLVIVTRSDASAGLHSVRFGDPPEGTTIGRLGVQWLSQWLAQITADDGKGEVIANPRFRMDRSEIAPGARSDASRRRGGRGSSSTNPARLPRPREIEILDVVGLSQGDGGGRRGGSLCTRRDSRRRLGERAHGR